METSQRPLSVDSFSKSWLNSLRPSFEDDSMMELDSNWTPTKRFISHTHDFSFDSNLARSPIFILHADELFSNGLVMPIFINPSKMEASDCIAQPPPPPAAKGSSTGALIPSRGSGKVEWMFLRRYRRSSRRIFMSFLKALYQKFQGSSRVRRSAAESIDIDREVSCSSNDLSDIDEAVLHCKKSLAELDNGRNLPESERKAEAPIASKLLFGGKRQEERRSGIGEGGTEKESITAEAPSYQGIKEGKVCRSLLSETTN